MGFFEDTKPPESSPVIQETKQDWLVVLIGSMFAFAALLLTGLGKAYWYVMKPLLTFEEKTRSQILNRLSIFLLVHVVPLYFLYSIPSVRDWLTLSKTHTINHTNGYRIAFPSREHFVTKDTRIGHQFEGRLYFTYAGYDERTMQKIELGSCQMVPRGLKIRLGSITLPTNAEGFENEVHYHVLQKVATLSRFEYALEWVKRPKLWLNQEELGEVVVEIEKKSSWQQLFADWNTIQPNNGGSHRPFEVKALSTEHAVICF